MPDHSWFVESLTPADQAALIQGAVFLTSQGTSMDDKYLFLDLDGVVNDHSRPPYSPYTSLHPPLIQKLNYVIRETKCGIVLSSSWRYLMFGDKPRMSLEGFNWLLQSHGFVGKLVSHTCPDERIAERAQQIEDWIISNNVQPNGWAAVDDLDLKFSTRSNQRRFVRTQGHIGLTDENVNQLIQLLSISNGH